MTFKVVLWAGIIAAQSIVHFGLGQPVWSLAIVAVWCAALLAGYVMGGQDAMRSRGAGANE